MSKTNNIYKNLGENINFIKQSNMNTLKKRKYDTRKFKINYHELIKMILGGRNITKNYLNKSLKIKIEHLIPVIKERFTIYKSPNSNKQFSTVYNSKNIIFKHKLIEMIYEFINSNKIDDVLKLLKEGKNDEIILNFIKKHSFKTSTSSFRKYKITKMADQIIKYTKNYTNCPKVLDIGIGNGKNLKQLAKMINIKQYGTDIKEWGPYSNKKQKKFNFPFKYIQLDPYKIPYKSNYFDCIILSLVLHHVDIIDNVLNECYRLLKKNGIVVIIEHDVWNDYDNMIIDLQHTLFSKIYSEQIPDKGSYYNFFEWDYIFLKNNFIPIFGDNILSDFQGTHMRYDNQFIGIYKKKDSI